jgi:hypothetical protein
MDLPGSRNVSKELPMSRIEQLIFAHYPNIDGGLDSSQSCPENRPAPKAVNGG